MTGLILKPRPLRLEDLPLLQALGGVGSDLLILDRSPKGYKLKTPVRILLEKPLAVGQRSLVEYINSLPDS